MDMSYINRQIEEGKFTSITEGRGGTCQIVEVNGDRYLSKTCPIHPQSKGLSELEFQIFKYFKFHMPSTVYINCNATAEQLTEKEFSTIQAWDSLGIPSSKPIVAQGNRAVYGFMEGHSFRNSMDGDELNEEDFGRILDCYHNIRDHAKSREDIELLHSDPFADNFFYDKERGLVVPIDPGKVVRKRSFEEIDGRINLFFLCKIFHLETTDENRTHYLRQATDRLTRDERRTVAALNKDPWIQRAYFEFMGKKFGANNLSVYYSDKTTGKIQTELKRKN